MTASHQTSRPVQAEVLDEQGRVIFTQKKTTDSRVGVWTGFVALAGSVVVLLAGLVLTLFLLPFLLLGRLLGLQLRRLHR